MKIIAVTMLLAFAGWTLATNLTVLAGGSLRTLEVAGPLAIVIVPAIYFVLNRAELKFFEARPETSFESHSINDKKLWFFVACACSSLVFLRFNWAVFWALALAMFFYAVISARIAGLFPAKMPHQDIHGYYPWVIATVVIAILVTISASRSDADDAFYVAVAAFHAGHTDIPLLSLDPMHGEHGWPLIFPRFTSYELLAAQLSKTLGLPAVHVVYQLLPPLAAIMCVMAFFLCAQELMPKRWVLVGLVAFVFTLLLGEQHRSYANFAFVRLFQGKAIFLTVIVPLIYWLSFKFVSERGRKCDLMLLVCAQIAGIGFSSFALLAAPLTGITAAFTAMPPTNRKALQRFMAMSATTCVALPYLLIAATESQETMAYVSTYPFESPAQVWKSVFGDYQQYFVAALLVFGPLLCRDALLRWRLAAPPLFLLGILLNPWIAGFLSKHLTSNILYWRVVWVVPMTIWLAVALCVIIECAWTERNLKKPSFWTFLVLIPLLAIAIPFNSLRADNYVKWDFWGLKVEKGGYETSVKTIQATSQEGRILSQETIASILPRLEGHPRLIYVRNYLDFLTNSIGKRELAQRNFLRDFVNQPCRSSDRTNLTSVLQELQVETIVTTESGSCSQASLSAVLSAQNFQLIENHNGYQIWHQQLPAKPPDARPTLDKNPAAQ
jgi:hypothetical protein